ncbi:hypothetical protein LNP25_20820 [Klebsiella variicola subsp. variicola]|nr:hypothetical protein [Klebsiella variicola subsp. variicola]
MTYARYSASVILLSRNDEKLRAVARRLNARAAFPPAGLPSTC